MKNDRSEGSTRSTRRWSVGRWAAGALAAGALLTVTMTASVAGAETATTISTAKDAKFGTILVAGDTPVYILKSAKGTCDATCQAQRPPVLLPQGVTTPTAGKGVDAAKLGTMAADGGGLQVTYTGRPLYFSAKDTGSGKPHGIGSDKFGKWVVVVPKGAASSNSGGGGGGSNPGSGGVSF
jgi:predicted lipoprotein with Yx(FWY)xxD motif